MVFVVAFMLATNGIYNEKRREKLREEYEDDDVYMRQRRVAEVVVYEAATIALLVFAIWRMAKNVPAF